MKSRTLRQSLLVQVFRAAAADTAGEHMEPDVDNSEGSDFEVDRIGRQLEFEDNNVARGRERKRGGARNRGTGRSLLLSWPRRWCGVHRHAATVGEQLDRLLPNNEKPDIPNVWGVLR